VVADLPAGEVQVLHHLLLGQAEVLGQARVAQVLQRVAAGAVVHVQLGAALQRTLVAEVGTRLLDLAAGGGQGGGRQQQAGGGDGEPSEHAGADPGECRLIHAWSPVPATAWFCRASSRSAWSGRSGSTRR